ncbi:MAG: energy-coupled thiamine transporter ThiT [Lachnospiraceae bacterium]|nr:energy-coupled thiamine transporter ThiT [Lachnospiraceae bacterium]
MFYNTVVNDWDEMTYVPTIYGNIVLAIIILALLAAALFFAGKQTSKNSSISKPSVKLTIKQLAFCAMALALGTVLSNLKIFDMPMGGSITLLSMLIICLPGYWFGLGAGLFAGVAYGILQLLIEPYVLYPMQMLIDYPLAFGALGLSGLFSNSKFGLIKGYIVGVIGRYIFTVISGFVFFANYTWEGWDPLPYSLAYNGSYIFTEAAITIIILLLPPVKEAMSRVKKLASE